MTPQDFIRKWKPVALTERATAQEHFLDLCRLFDHPTPAEDDPTGERFTFEKGVVKTGGGDGYADVWKKGFFAWEYKKKKRDLEKALEQLTRYAAALENPPLHVACDTHIFRIETRWTNEVPTKYEFDLDDLAEPKNLEILRCVFYEPEKLRSGQTRAKLTKEAADKFQSISDSLQHRYPDKEAVAHFVNQLVFCFFADSVGLLPHGVWRKLLETAARKPEKSQRWFEQLFADMKDGGDFNLEDIPHFNGGLFDGRPPLELDHVQIGLLLAAASMDWSLIDPTIFGTLFERFLDPDKRAQIGAHYTDPDKIMMIVEPVIARPLRQEWEAAQAEIEAIMAPVLARERRRRPHGGARARKALRGGAHQSGDAARRFHRSPMRLAHPRPRLRLRQFPLSRLAGGQGHRISRHSRMRDARPRHGRAARRPGNPARHRDQPVRRGARAHDDLDRRHPMAGAQRDHPSPAPDPAKARLDRVPRRVADGGREGGGVAGGGFYYRQPAVPRRQAAAARARRRNCGDAVSRLRRCAFPPRPILFVTGSIRLGRRCTRKGAKSAGLVATNSIRGGANRKVMEPIAEAGAIFEAWSDEPWTIDGAAVRVSLVCFDAITFARSAEEAVDPRVDGIATKRVNADLTGGLDLTASCRLAENIGPCIEGMKKYGPFDVSGTVARSWLVSPLNANGRPNSDVVKPWLNAMDIVRSNSDTWVIDFAGMSLSDAQFYEEPFRIAHEKVLPGRALDRARRTRERWWVFERERPELRRRTAHIARFLVTPVVAKHRLFVWLDARSLIANLVVAIARDDDTTFGILHSRFHEAWSLRLGTWLGVGNDPRYTPTTTFETFPFPAGLTPNIPAEDYADDPRAKKSPPRRRSSTTCAALGSIRPISSTSFPR